MYIINFKTKMDKMKFYNNVVITMHKTQVKNKKIYIKKQLNEMSTP
jgi:hypothetical protein